MGGGDRHGGVSRGDRVLVVVVVGAEEAVLDEGVNVGHEPKEPGGAD